MLDWELSAAARRESELVSCPNKDGGSSLLCDACDYLHPIVPTTLFLGFLLFLSCYPNHEWMAFQRLFELWYGLFDFKVVIDQERFVPGERYIFVMHPHGE